MSFKETLKAMNVDVDHKYKGVGFMCANCGGTGSKTKGKKDCRVCGGSGTVKYTRRFEVK
jgi:DnaJ-class molecular chaperone